MTTSGDTQVLTRIPVAGSPAGPLPTVALTLAVAAPDATQELASIRPEPAPAESAGESHDRIYEEAMATIAALASNWSSAVQRTTGRHRAAA